MAGIRGASLLRREMFGSQRSLLSPRRRPISANLFHFQFNNVVILREAEDLVATRSFASLRMTVFLDGNELSQPAGWVECSDTHHSCEWTRWVSLRSTHPIALASMP
jgi:hypothetical protein